MNEKSKREKRGKSRRKPYHVLAQREFYIFLAGKSTTQMNYSSTKQMFAACRDGAEQLDIVKESLLLSEKSFLLMISHIWLHKRQFVLFWWLSRLQYKLCCRTLPPVSHTQCSRTHFEVSNTQFCDPIFIYFNGLALLLLYVLTSLHLEFTFCPSVALLKLLQMNHDHSWVRKRLFVAHLIF